MKFSWGNTERKVTEFWNKNTDKNFTGATYWLANPIVNRRYQLKASGGRDFAHWVDFTVEHFLSHKRPVDLILSIGSGDGSLERHLAVCGTAHLIHGVDLAPARIEIARREAIEADLCDTINYFVCNVESNPLPGEAYDAIYFNASLHHMFDLDGILQKCALALKPDGFLFVNEYIGPNYFAFNEREKQVMQSVFQMIPAKYRISHHQQDRGKIRSKLSLPDPAIVKRTDPSEAIYSEEIMGALHRHFHISELNVACGTIMQFVLEGIAGNFHEDDPESLKILDLICRIEDTLVENGDLRPHFAMIIAQRLQS